MAKQETYIYLQHKIISKIFKVKPILVRLPKKKNLNDVQYIKDENQS
jgi:hypothetical protein